MSVWGAARYGDPCQECHFLWSLSQTEAMDLVGAVPASYAELLAGHDGSLRVPGLDWTAAAYVSHVNDNLRIWAERLAGAALGGDAAIPDYDQSLLGVARRYNEVPLPAALWSLGHAAQNWLAAVELASTAGVTLIHPEGGQLRVEDVSRLNAHDSYHHGWDIRRSLQQSAT
jgi:hypothetical protein